jgi:hypothetical protein
MMLNAYDRKMRIALDMGLFNAKHFVK